MRYEYKFIYSDSERDFETKLNGAGAEGWRVEQFEVNNLGSRIGYRYNALLVREIPRD